MIISAYKFTETNKAFDELKDSRHYKLMAKIEDNQKSENYGLTEQDENWIVENIRSNSFFNNGSIPLLGWAFDFRPICKEYWIKYVVGIGVTPELIAILAPNKEAAIRYVESHILYCNDDYDDCYDGEILEIREPEESKTISKQSINKEKAYLFTNDDYLPIKEIQPKNGTDFSLQECYDLIGCELIETYNLDDMLIICDEEGLLKRKPLNKKFNEYIDSLGKKGAPHFVGNVMLIQNSQLK